MKEQIIDILKDFTELKRENISDETNLVADMGLNSLDVMNIVVTFEEAFDIEIPDRVIPQFVTVGDIVGYLEEHR